MSSSLLDDEVSLASRAAWLHYAGGLTQGEVAARLNIPAIKAHRLIARAGRDGLIRIFVDGAVTECLRLEEMLKARFNLEVAQVAPALGEVGLPMKALAFAGANLGKQGRANGILTALEASSLNLWGTKLVTLSACETGVGEVRNGEGVYGLRRAFVIAGAETVVMSLWPVSDYVTRELMTSYYRGLKSGLGRGDALRQAQLAMLGRKGREHPFYWASFIQVGEWANLDEKR